MPRYDEFDEDELDDGDDPESDSDDDAAETIPCPYCGKPVYEEAERCPACASYISREDAPARPARWLAICVLVCLALVACWIIGC